MSSVQVFPQNGTVTWAQTRMWKSFHALMHYVPSQASRNRPCESVDSVSPCFADTFSHRRVQTDRDGRGQIRGGLLVVWRLIQTWPRQLRNHKTTSRQATAPHVKTEYQMKQTPILPCLHHCNCLGECIWWIMKRFFFSWYNSLLLALLLSLSVSSLSPPVLYVILNELLCAPSTPSLHSCALTSHILLLSFCLLSSSLLLSSLHTNPPHTHKHTHTFLQSFSLPLSVSPSLFNVHNSVLFRREPWRSLW